MTFHKERKGLVDKINTKNGEGKKQNNRDSFERRDKNQQRKRRIFHDSWRIEKPRLWKGRKS